MTRGGFDDYVVAAVAEGLARLPGVDAQLRMAPVPRGGWKPGFAPDQAKPAAALLLMFPADGRPVILLTKRASALPNHAGQVSLPGGAVDPGETIEDAALREAGEEVGLARADVKVLGRIPRDRESIRDLGNSQQVCSTCGGRTRLEEYPAAFFERLQQAATSPASSLALLVVDIHGFHSINQAHGFAIGDRFLDMGAGAWPSGCARRISSRASAATSLRCCCPMSSIRPARALRPAIPSPACTTRSCSMSTGMSCRRMPASHCVPHSAGTCANC